MLDEVLVALELLYVDAEVKDVLSVDMVSEDVPVDVSVADSNLELRVMLIDPVGSAVVDVLVGPSLSGALPSDSVMFAVKESPPTCPRQSHSTVSSQV